MTSPSYYYIPYEGTFSPLFLQKQTEEECLLKAGAGSEISAIHHQPNDTTQQDS
jgi:hypothetical protein